MEFSGGRGGADICPQNVAFALNSNFPCKGLFLMISVVMAAYNGEQYISEQLRSIWNQTQRPDEIIISDDHSSDRTVAVVRDFAKRTGAPVRLIENQERTGYIRNFFCALKHAGGDYVFLSDQDDIWLPNKIQRCIDILSEHKEVSALSTNYCLIDENNAVIKRKFRYGGNFGLCQVSLHQFLRHPKYPGMAMVIRRELLEEGLKQPSYQAAHDWQLNYLAARKQALFYCPEVLAYYRQHGNNTVGTAVGGKSREPRQDRIKMLAALLNNVELYFRPGGPEAGYLWRLRQVLQRRLRLLGQRRAGRLLVYDLCHLNFVSFRSALGDLYVCIKENRNDDNRSRYRNL